MKSIFDFPTISYYENSPPHISKVHLVDFFAVHLMEGALSHETDMKAAVLRAYEIADAMVVEHQKRVEIVTYPGRPKGKDEKEASE